MGLVDVPKTRDTRPPWISHIGGIQALVEWEVHVAQNGAQGWDGVLGACPRGQGRLFGELCPRLQSYTNYGSHEVGVLLQPHFWKSVRMTLTLLKWGLGSPRNFRVGLQGSKHLALGCSLYHWKAMKV